MPLERTKRAKPGPEPTFADVLRELELRGLLQRATVIVVGPVSVQLNPYAPAPPPVNETPDERAERERREEEANIYASS
jgi:hypothetical protein